MYRKSLRANRLDAKRKRCAQMRTCAKCGKACDVKKKESALWREGKCRKRRRKMLIRDMLKKLKEGDDE